MSRREQYLKEAHLLANKYCKLEKYYMSEEKLSKIAKETISGVAKIKEAKNLLMIDEFNFFYDTEQIICVLVVGKIIDNENKYLIKILPKSLEMLAVLSKYEWLRKPFTNKQVIQKQKLQRKEIYQLFKDKEAMNVIKESSGHVRENLIFFNNKGSVIRYDVLNQEILENDPLDSYKELFRLFDINSEYLNVDNTIKNERKKF